MTTTSLSDKLDKQYGSFTKDDRFRVICAGLISLGVSPTPLVLQNFDFGNGRHLGGNRSKIRIEEFERAGWVNNGRIWIQPSFTEYGNLKLTNKIT